jgi:acyl-CoA synthetase (NDP forming)
MLDANQPQGAERILERRLRTSIADLQVLTTRPVRLDTPAAAEGLSHAQAYAQKHGLGDTLIQATEIKQRLQRPK